MTEQSKLIIVAVIVGMLGLVSGFALFSIMEKPASTVAAEAEAPEEHKEGAADAVAVTAEQIQNANIGVQPVAMNGVGSEVIAQGAVMSAPAGGASLTAHASGTVTRIFKRVGEAVRAGEVLAIVEGRDAAQIAADRSAASAKATLAQRNLAREKSLFEQGVTSKASYEQAEAEAAAAMAETNRAQSAAGSSHVTGDGKGVSVVSPINGAVVSSSAKLGAFVQSETELFQVADPKQVQVEASISAADRERISAGDRALIESPGGEVIEAKVRSVTPGLDAVTRLATAILDVPEATLTAGTTLRVRIIPQSVTQQQALTVPDDAVQNVEGRPVVFVRTESGFEARTVLVGRQGAGRTEIQRGLKSGEQIAVRNAFVLKAELGKSAEEH